MKHLWTFRNKSLILSIRDHTILLSLIQYRQRRAPRFKNHLRLAIDYLRLTCEICTRLNWTVQERSIETCQINIAAAQLCITQAHQPNLAITTETRQARRFQRNFASTLSPQSASERRRQTRVPTLLQLYAERDRALNEHGPLMQRMVPGRSQSVMFITTPAGEKKQDSTNLLDERATVQNLGRTIALPELGLKSLFQLRYIRSITQAIHMATHRPTYR